MFFNKDDNKQKVADLEDELDQLKHDHMLVQRRKDRYWEKRQIELVESASTDAMKIEELESIIEDHDNITAREREVKSREKAVEDRAERLETAEEGLETRREWWAGELDRRGKRLDIREKALEKAESDKDNAGYKRGYAEGKTEGFEHGVSIYDCDNKRFHDSLRFQAATGAFGKLEASDDASKTLGDAFARHLTGTIERVMDSEDDGKND